MTRQDHIIKWAVYALALLPLCLVQQYVLGRWLFLGTAPLLLPLAAIAVGMLEGPMAGSIYGMWVGLAWFLCGEWAISVLLMTLAGLAAGVLASGGLRRNFFGYALVALGLLMTGEVLRILMHLVRGLSGPAALLPVILGEVASSLVFSIPVYLLYRAVWRRVGESRLA